MHISSTFIFVPPSIWNGRYKPDSTDRPLLRDFPAECSGEQPNHRSAGEEPAYANRHQPLPALPGCQRPDAVRVLHAFHSHS